MAEVVFSQTCICGRAFSDLGTFTCHEKGCRKGKKRLASALEKAKEVYHGKKARLAGSLTQRRTRRANCRLPLRFWDMLPEPPLPLPPPGVLPHSLVSSAPQEDGPTSSSRNMPLIHKEKPTRSLRSSLRKIFKTQINKFGLFRVYDTESLPRHDPEDPYSVDNACLPCADGSDPVASDEPLANPYFPDPNEGAMHLGDWYWNQGAQKSRDSFKQLIDIVGDPSFSPTAAAHTSWDAIDDQLSHNQFNSDQPEWLGEDHRWKCSSVTILVPFHSRAKNPGPKDYAVNGFYHHSLVSIIWEKVTNPTHAPLFHFEPYEL
ncbi:hypothetical protein HYDPIDRAFT_95568 [Hydnomerulius pinastri MD-312]|uniref:Uncharacterized protein n=1 Tax=Hydnomerulius pinastri MD-312 TaxID=994086 RepID=A0A0C9V8A4_9AGAM|nr:hypothetical protein HYDPIDRAFT_95568 [Hydnomerulius pinastri MD-312]